MPQTPNLTQIKALYEKCWRKTLNLALTGREVNDTLDHYGKNSPEALAKALSDLGEEPIFTGRFVVATKNNLYLYNSCEGVSTPPAILGFHLAQRAVREVVGEIDEETMKKAAEIADKVLAMPTRTRKTMNINVWIDPEDINNYDKFGINDISSLVLALYNKANIIVGVVGDAVAFHGNKIFVYRLDLPFGTVHGMLAALRGFSEAGTITAKNAKKIAKKLQQLIDEYKEVFGTSYDCSSVCGDDDDDP